ncbi:MAG: 2OG-Fe(II) oxygenase [Hyphomicrobiaceae bacterium]|nr:2OG-Fe(II) oxygenase [Hyphomicrobiaceae bacterium]
MLDLAAIAGAAVAPAPFPYLVAHGVLSAVDLAAVRADFPAISKAGLFPLSELNYGTTFAHLVEELNGAPFAGLMGERLGLELANRPVMVTVRGQCHKRDGSIHADSKAKVATCVLYLNDIWDESGGRLRMLRSSNDIDDYAAEVPPDGGTLVAYARTEHSWHGHKSYVGERRYIMLNWMVSKSVLVRELARHGFTAMFKRRFAMLSR